MDMHAGEHRLAAPFPSFLVDRRSLEEQALLRGFEGLASQLVAAEQLMLEVRREASRQCWLPAAHEGIQTSTNNNAPCLPPAPCCSSRKFLLWQSGWRHAGLLHWLHRASRQQLLMPQRWAPPAPKWHRATCCARC